MRTPNLVLAVGLILLSIGYRLFGTIPNFSPVMAVSLFSGVILLNKKLSFLVPLSIMAVSDLILAATQTWTTFWNFLAFQPVVYGSLLLVVLLGTFIKNKNVLSIGAATLSGSVIFFIITNFFVWLDPFGWSMYAHTFDGLIQAYVAAIPFFRWSLLSDVLFSGVLFGAYHAITSTVPLFKEAAA